MSAKPIQGQKYLLDNVVVAYNALPATGISTDGFFVATQNISMFNTPNYDANGIDPSGNVVDIPFVDTVIDPTTVVGTESNPYLPINLPAYIPTLFSNVAQINKNLIDDLSVHINDDNRLYPTAWAVKSYVESQISGTQFLPYNPMDSSANLPTNDQLRSQSYNGTVEMTTGVSNNFIVDFPPAKDVSGNNLPRTTKLAFSGLDASGNISEIGNVYIYTLEPTMDVTRNGAKKMIMSNVKVTPTSMLTAYAGDYSWFVVGSTKYKYYQFTYVGDFFEMVQFINDYSDPLQPENLYFVTQYNSKFYEYIDKDQENQVNGIVTDGTGAPVTTI